MALILAFWIALIKLEPVSWLEVVAFNCESPVCLTLFGFVSRKSGAWFVFITLSCKGLYAHLGPNEIGFVLQNYFSPGAPGLSAVLGTPFGERRTLNVHKLALFFQIAFPDFDAEL